jgi:hypothetical protein
VMLKQISFQFPLRKGKNVRIRDFEFRSAAQELCTHD